MTVYAHGTCQQVSEDTVRCTVIAGEEGEAQLIARVDPPYSVRIDAVSLPPWAQFTGAAGSGRVETQCTFVPPQEAVGGTHYLVFRATTLYGVSRDLVLILDVVAPEEAG